MDLSTLSASERKAWLEKRKPRKKIVVEEDTEEDSFDVSEYSQFWKKWSVELSGVDWKSLC